MPEIKNTEELYVECDDCRERAEHALCDKHRQELVDDAFDDGKKAGQQESA
jgi:hypothetical protein